MSTGALSSVSVASTATLSLSLSWDVCGKPVDLDLVCVAIDASGLILDACFFNNPSALGGGLSLSGDSKDGAEAGDDETIHLKLAAAPPHTYAFVFGVYCTKEGDFSHCETAAVNLTVDASPSPSQAMALGGVGKATCVLVCTVRRAEGNRWDVSQIITPFPAPHRNFVDSFASILGVVQIDPLMAQELKKLQPTYNLTKGQTASIPVGIPLCKFGLGWDSQCDLDASCIGLKENGTHAFTCYFGAKDPINGVVTSSGDNTTGAGAGDDEVITVKLGSVPLDVVALFFTVNVFTSFKNFNDVQGEYIRLMVGSQVLVHFKSLDSGKLNGLVTSIVYRNPQFIQQWMFKAVGMAAEGRTAASLIDECQGILAELKKGGWKASSIPASTPAGTPTSDGPMPAPMPTSNPSDIDISPRTGSIEITRTQHSTTAAPKSSNGCCTIM